MPAVPSILFSNYKSSVICRSPNFSLHATNMNPGRAASDRLAGKESCSTCGSMGSYCL